MHGTLTVSNVRGILSSELINLYAILIKIQLKLCQSPLMICDIIHHHISLSINGNTNYTFSNNINNNTTNNSITQALANFYQIKNK